MQLDIKSSGFFRYHLKFLNEGKVCYHAEWSMNDDKRWMLYDSATNELKLTISKKTFFRKRPTYLIHPSDATIAPMEHAYNRAAKGYQGQFHEGEKFLLHNTSVLKNGALIGGRETISWGIWGYKDVLNISDLSHKELVIAFFLVFNDIMDD